MRKKQPTDDDVLIVVPVKAKIKSTNKSEKASDGGHETRTIERVQVDKEAYNGGGPVDDALCSKKMHGMEWFKKEGGEEDAREGIKVGDEWDDGKKGSTYLVFKAFTEAWSAPKAQVSYAG